MPNHPALSLALPALLPHRLLSLSLSLFSFSFLFLFLPRLSLRLSLALALSLPSVRSFSRIYFPSAFRSSFVGSFIPYSSFLSCARITFLV